MAVLIDSSFLVALAVTKDAHHLAALQTAAALKTKMILPVPVMPETFYMVYVRVNYAAAVDIYKYMQTGGFQIEPLTADDRSRMGEIMDKYRDAEFDFVDLALMAISERLGITQVCTIDHWDFSIFRPKHISSLELLPK